MLILCFLCVLTSCENERQDKNDTVILDSGTLFAENTQKIRTGQITEIYSIIHEEAEGTESADRLETMQNIISGLGESGYAAIDSENQVDMINAGLVLDFCDAVDTEERAELTIVEVMYGDAEPNDTYEFRKYDLRTEGGKVDISRGYYCFDGRGNSVREDTVDYSADLWKYTEEGYLVFEGSYFADDYYIVSLTDAPEYAAFRVAPLDAVCRTLCREYIQPVGYEDNNLFLVDWTEEDFGAVDFYDLFDRFYPMVHRQPFPYKASENPGIGAVCQVSEKEFENVVGTHLDIAPDVLHSKTDYIPASRSYMYRPRGFYEIGCSNMPYPEVTGYTENHDNTITLTVNAVFPYECTSKAFSHEVVIRPLEDGGFQYVSNRIIGGSYDAWWRAERLTDEEWEEVYAAHDMAGTEAQIGQGAYEEEDFLWYLPHAEASLLTAAEEEGIRNNVLAAAGKAAKVYQNVEIEDGASYASNVRNFSGAQCREVAALLGKAGYISVTENANMENYQNFEVFYQEYRNGQDATVTVFHVNRDGLIGAVTFIYRKVENEDRIQTYYVGVGWKAGGVPMIKNTLVSDVAEMRLTEKGYFIYSYKELLVHSDEKQYWRVRPLSEPCRELTEKYVAGLSFTNYNAFVTDWDSSNADDILMPCMFEDIYRMDTGENIGIGTDWIPSEVYERIMTTYFPVSGEQLRAKCGYDADKDSYPYEMISAVPYPPFGEVVDYAENPDGTITLYVDGVWIEYDSDCAFANEIVVQPFADGTFRYLSNKIQPRELELPSAASDAKEGTVQG